MHFGTCISWKYVFTCGCIRLCVDGMTTICSLHTVPSQDVHKSLFLSLFSNRWKLSDGMGGGLKFLIGIRVAMLVMFFHPLDSLRKHCEQHLNSLRRCYPSWWHLTVQSETVVATHQGWVVHFWCRRTIACIQQFGPDCMIYDSSDQWWRLAQCKWNCVEKHYVGSHILPTPRGEIHCLVWIEPTLREY